MPLAHHACTAVCPPNFPPYLSVALTTTYCPAVPIPISPCVPATCRLPVFSCRVSIAPAPLQYGFCTSILHCCPPKYALYLSAAPTTTLHTPLSSLHSSNPTGVPPSWTFPDPHPSCTLCDRWYPCLSHAWHRARLSTSSHTPSLSTWQPAQAHPGSPLSAS